MPKPGFRGTHRDAAMLPGPTERLVPEAEGAMDEDRDPNPCEEDEEFFKARPNAEEMEAAISKFLYAMPALETDGFSICTGSLHGCLCPIKRGSGAWGMMKLWMAVY